MHTIRDHYTPNEITQNTAQTPNEIPVFHQTRSWCFSHLYCEEMGSYQAAKVHVMCSQDPNQHKSRSKVCSYWIVIPQNTCQNWRKWSRLVKDLVWCDLVWFLPCDTLRDNILIMKLTNSLIGSVHNLSPGWDRRSSQTYTKILTQFPSRTLKFKLCPPPGSWKIDTPPSQYDDSTWNTWRAKTP